VEDDLTVIENNPKLQIVKKTGKLVWNSALLLSCIQKHFVFNA